MIAEGSFCGQCWRIGVDGALWGIDPSLMAQADHSDVRSASVGFFATGAAGAEFSLPDRFAGHRVRGCECVVVELAELPPYLGAFD
ncbi:hypothetical protein [Mycobacteroides abscessus]|uniref:hypothetical protein n=1 Tax=Mycobacteroides abscessus TaxID=36809 RepID=UPI0009CF35C4|nr:hypothetical protein [Mycobacteroides abscessus]SKI12534.1 Uncharacterised protein [Mycobacteroides abscessus subsp. massiliense]SKM20383.1 Uncharacterised protein [Mycobacteroides abscessus subsp. massiliense]